MGSFNIQLNGFTWYTMIIGTIDIHNALVYITVNNPG